MTSVVVGRRGGVCANRRAGRPTSGFVYWKFGVDVLLVAPLGSSWPPEIPKSLVDIHIIFLVSGV